MFIRRAVFSWLFPAALVLPLWLFVAWGVFSAGGWAFLWVLFIAIPSVLIGQLVLTFLTRSRPSVRTLRAVSWLDVAGFGVWHALTISLGFFSASWWAPVMVLTVLVGIAMFWMQTWQLLREVRGVAVIQHTSSGAAYIPASEPQRPKTTSAKQPVIIIEESSQGER